MVESTPTAERNKAELKRIQEKAGTDSGTLSDAASPDASASGAIDFTITF